LHFRTYGAHYWTMSVMGQSMTMSLRQTSDSYVSPALKSELGDLDSTSFGPEALKSIMTVMSASMPTGMDSVMVKSATKVARIGRAGTPLKSVVDGTTAMLGLIKRQKQTVEILKIEKAIVPDSLFVVPGDYKKVDSPIQMPPMPDSSARTSRSLRRLF
jgi:hypothetical protein